ncbi:MAG TPA: hypothetical protein VFT98_03305 [Myxococcota bacterium]|nr:hypothetical protein [Myxococcota bacterium]
MLAREILLVRLIGWGLFALCIFEVAMRWTHSDREAGLVLPSNDAVPFGLLGAVGFELAGRALSKIAASAGATAKR